MLPLGDGSSAKLGLGETMRFDEIGPVITNTDGTVRRIANWQELTDREREVTLRRIGNRNRERTAALKSKAIQEEEVEGCIDAPTM
ncbi:unnamed protein product [Choristocarpus tenellus]